MLVTLLLLCSVVVYGSDQVTTTNYIDNKDALTPSLQPVSGTVGIPIRLTITMRDGGGLAYSIATNNGEYIRAAIIQADAVANGTNGPAVTIAYLATNVFRASWTPTLSGAAQLTAYAYQSNGTLMAQVASHDLNISAAQGNTATLSLIPLSDVTGYVGIPSLRWGGIYASTGTFDTLTISNLNVGGTLSAIDTSKVAIAGGGMTGALTNTVNFVGNGAGLTNLTGVLTVSSLVTLSNAVAGAVTDIVQGVGGGILVSNTAGRFYVSATNASGGSGGDVYLASNQTFTGGNTFRAQGGNVILADTLADTAAGYSNWVPFRIRMTNIVPGVVEDNRSIGFTIEDTVTNWGVGSNTLRVAGISGMANHAVAWMGISTFGQVTLNGGFITSSNAMTGNAGISHEAIGLSFGQGNGAGDMRAIGYDNIAPNTAETPDMLLFRYIFAGSSSANIFHWNGDSGSTQNPKTLTYAFHQPTSTVVIATNGNVAIGSVRDTAAGETVAERLDVIGGYIRVGQSFGLKIGTNAILAIDATTTNLLFITLSPAVTNMLNKTPI